MSEKTPTVNNKVIKDAGKTVTEEAAVKKVSKKSTVKKAPSKKTSADNTKLTESHESQHSGTIDSGIVATLQSFTSEMNKDRESRDKQMTSLINEFRTGFETLNKQTSKQERSREDEITALYQSLQKAISEIRHGSELHEEQNLSTFQILSDSIMKDHEQTLKEVLEQEKLQDKKLKYIDKVQSQRISINRLIADADRLRRTLPERRPGRILHRPDPDPDLKGPDPGGKHRRGG